VPAERIVSLVPGATEALFALGLGDRVRAVSHECGHPPEVGELPVASRTRLDAEADSGAIDDAVQEAVDVGEPMFEVHGEVVHHAQPDLVVTQGACDVCGITSTDVEAKLARFEPGEGPDILELHPHTLQDVLDGIDELAQRCGVPDEGEAFLTELTDRIAAVEVFAERRDERPTVAALDWLDPPMAAGHWLPGMIEAAGGRPVLVHDASPSTYVDWADVREADPDVLLLVPCGFDRARTREEMAALSERDGWEQLSAVEAGRVVTLDAGAYTSRPGPRLVGGLEQLACALHVDAAGRWPEQADRVDTLG
jgi:iron complex transport system substrate-binding protein